MSRFLKRHEPKFYWGGLILFVIYLYFMASVTCANGGVCWVANGDLANWVLSPK